MANLTQEEIFKIFAQTKLLLVPLIEGSGTRLKIVEAIFSGAHVLSTPLGAEGINSELINISELNAFEDNFKKIIESDLGQINKEIAPSFWNEFDLDQWNKMNGSKIKQAITE